MSLHGITAIVQKWEEHRDRYLGKSYGLDITSDDTMRRPDTVERLIELINRYTDKAIPFNELLELGISSSTINQAVVAGLVTRGEGGFLAIVSLK